MVVKLYIYNKKTRALLYSDLGNPEYIINDLGDDKDFTLTAPPMVSGKQWFWRNEKWIGEPIVQN